MFSHFFPDQTPFPSRDLDTNQAYPHSKWRTDAEKNDKSSKHNLNTSKKPSSVQKSSKSTVFFVISLPLYGTSIPRKYAISRFVFNNLIHFFSERFFPKNREIGRFYARDVNVVSGVKAVSRRL